MECQCVKFEVFFRERNNLKVLGGKMSLSPSPCPCSSAGEKYQQYADSVQLRNGKITNKMCISLDHVRQNNLKRYTG